jgi:hypothetical protein
MYHGRGTWNIDIPWKSTWHVDMPWDDRYMGTARSTSCYGCVRPSRSLPSLDNLANLGPSPQPLQLPVAPPAP